MAYKEDEVKNQIIRLMFAQKLPSINSYGFLWAYVCSCVWIAQVYFALSVLLWLPVYSLVNDYHHQGHYDQGHIFTRSTAYQTWCFIGKWNNYTAGEILTPDNTLHNKSLWEVNRLLMGCEKVLLNLTTDIPFSPMCIFSWIMVQ